MNFLQQLSEAADIPLDQLKDKMKKDPRVKFIFSRGASLDMVKDPAEFVKTMRYYVFSNPNVRAHIEKRADRRDLSKHWWKRMAGRKPTDPLNTDEFSYYVELVKELFKDAGYAAKKDLSKRGYEWLTSNFNGARVIQDTYAMREVDSLDFKGDGALTLYRGLIFSERSLRSDDFSGSEGLKFLQSVRKGTRVADLDFTEAASVWTTDKNAALAAALYGSDSGWRKHKEGDPKKIEKHKGVLAFLVSTLAAPEDVIVDMREFSKVTGWPAAGDRAYNSVILKPGKIKSRIVSKHTQEGEEEVLGKVDDAIDLGDVKDRLGFLGKIIKLPMDEIKFDGMDRFTYDPEVMKQIGILIDPELKDKLGRLMNQVLQVYKKHIQPVDLKSVSDQAGEHSATFDALRKIHDLFDGYVYHRAYADPSASKRAQREYGTVEFKNMKTGDEALGAISLDMKLKDAAEIIANQKRFTQWSISHAWHGLAKIAEPNIVIPEKLHLASWQVQKKVVDAAVKGFYMVIGQDMPADKPTVWAADFSRVIGEANVVAKVAKFLQDLKELATEAGA